MLDRLSRGDKAVAALCIITLVAFVGFVIIDYKPHHLVHESRVKTHCVNTNTTSMAYVLCGDWENATVRWNVTRSVWNDTLYFAVSGPENNYFMVHGDWSAGYIALPRDYFLLFPYEGPSVGGSGYRGIHLYFRSDTCSAFNITLAIDGYCWRV